jgi:hypothetical protein
MNNNRTAVLAIVLVSYLMIVPEDFRLCLVRHLHATLNGSDECLPRGERARIGTPDHHRCCNIDRRSTQGVH